MGAAQAAGDLPGDDLDRQLRRVSLHDDYYDRTTDVGYALETQNRPVFDNDEGETVDDLTNVHEWAHQWYGNSVSLSDWGDIWLNEGLQRTQSGFGPPPMAGRALPSSSRRSTTTTQPRTLYGRPRLPLWKIQRICSVLRGICGAV
jgi:Peptidase family M1 domain